MKTKETLNNASVEEWKKQYGDVFKSIVSGKTIIWRKLKRSEYVDVMTAELDPDANKRVYQRQDIICKKVILYPENIDELLEQNGALSTCIAEEIMGRSGFDLSSTEEM